LPGQAIVDLKVMFQSTPFARRETPLNRLCRRTGNVSIHSLRKKRDRSLLVKLFDWGEFQSTPFARRETTVEGEVNRVIDVSIHSLRKKGDSCIGASGGFMDVSIHSLRKKGDLRRLKNSISSGVFQSTPFARRETSSGGTWTRKEMFQSTPFARRETATGCGNGHKPVCFNPLPSQEGRPAPSWFSLHNICFNPLPSQEGRLASWDCSRYFFDVSIHSLRKKGDESPG